MDTSLFRRKNGNGLNGFRRGIPPQRHSPLLMLTANLNSFCRLWKVSTQFVAHHALMSIEKLERLAASHGWEESPTVHQLGKIADSMRLSAADLLDPIESARRSLLEGTKYSRSPTLRNFVAHDLLDDIVLAHILAVNMRCGILDCDVQLDVERLEAATGISRERLTRFLHAQGLPSVADGYRIADALGVSVDDLLSERRFGQNIRDLEEMINHYEPHRMDEVSIRFSG
ncbi:hypothetical protein Pan216_29930 [Planctomycetes bacterium Pan216]|uniref:HTH cro/C1-type domain-containing protein n=1 Tax=Kolteria novifilia TaxID=2527975 RepID=A0A518B5A0_9BACT|nr:hypothetical protein Pan216_29930 [Planctomycetes bacterium Pan216]